ncbi:TauD/TfdA family dioxygenase [Sneathiella marina]|uniref:TauD/TfdA family dioxygenase n=1 Tax=Sneathiella marina TaxID=2950108 RepID=A0ABY4W8C9_9PROT|nr:TauD/TfdA family dioxygenase [Sneathiella marina]USG60911.1 TauD/TfdA family dioxygenase [Sneathiella marina]
MAFRSFVDQSMFYFDRPHTNIPARKIGCLADWRGPALRPRPEDWTNILTPSDIAEIEQAVDQVSAAGLDISEVSRDSFLLPTLSTKIQGWKSQIKDGLGFVLVKGLPVEEWGFEKSSLAYWGLGHHLGVPGAQNPDNELLGHVIDYSEERTNPLVRRYRTSGNIDFHCDAADVVGLLCINAARAGGQSRIASSVAIFNALFDENPDLIPLLFEPFFIDRRGEEKPGEKGYFRRPACRYADGELRTFYHSEYMRSAARFMDGETLDSGVSQILDFYDDAAASPDFHLDMYLEPGDMQFISNHSIIHARTEYQDYAEVARKRHLLRLWLSLS